MRVNTTRFVILGLLAEKPLTGYDIRKLVQSQFGYFWNESFGQIYPEMKKMSSEGLLEPVPAVDDESTGRPKKYYRITEEGRASFQEWMNSSPEDEKQRFEFLLKIYWAQWLPPARISEYVRDFMKRHGSELETLRRMELDIQSLIRDDPNNWWALQTVRLGRRMNEAYMAWASELITSMEGLHDRD